jgi:hypothetical protein
MSVYSSRVTTTEALTNAYVAAEVHAHSMNASHPARVAGLTFRGRLNSLIAHVDTIAAAPTTLTLRITQDAAGDVAVVPDVDAAIDLGIGDATTGSVAFSFPDLAWVDPDGKDLLYVWLKTDVGTANLISSAIGWMAE